MRCLASSPSLHPTVSYNSSTSSTTSSPSPERKKTNRPIHPPLNPLFHLRCTCFWPTSLHSGSLRFRFARAPRLLSHRPSRSRPRLEDETKTMTRPTPPRRGNVFASRRSQAADPRPARPRPPRAAPGDRRTVVSALRRQSRRGKRVVVSLSRARKTGGLGTGGCWVSEV